MGRTLYWKQVPKEQWTDTLNKGVIDFYIHKEFYYLIKFYEKPLDIRGKWKLFDPRGSLIAMSEDSAKDIIKPPVKWANVKIKEYKCKLL